MKEDGYGDMRILLSSSMGRIHSIGDYNCDRMVVGDIKMAVKRNTTVIMIIEDGAILTRGCMGYDHRS